MCVDLLKNKSRPEVAARDAAKWVISEREMRERLKREREAREIKEKIEREQRRKEIRERKEREAREREEAKARKGRFFGLVKRGGAGSASL